MAWFTLATQAYAMSMSIRNLCMGKDSLDVSIGINASVSKPCILLILKLISSQAAQTHYVWVRASKVIWSEYTRIISALSGAKKMQKS